jgi:hypothetical protein
MFGGLENLQAYIATTTDEPTISKLSTRTTKSVASVKADTTDTNDTKTRAPEKMSRCSIKLMKAWTMLYPPNIKPMCLHAVYLKLRHPVTGEICEWDAPTTF